YKELSEQLAASYQRLHDQAARLVQAEKELGQASKLSLLGHVSASLAHEIKNPLASIKGAAEILAEEVAPEHPKHEFVEIMRSEISRLNNSVEEVLSYCRGQKVEDSDEMLPLAQVLAQVVQVASPKIKGKGAKGTEIILPDFQTGAETIRVPSAAMTQVFMNLILNALDEIPDKGGVIHISLKRGEKTWVLTVEDNGPGLTPEKYDTVFKSFVTFKEGGTGLGLSISEKIVRRLGGEIFAGSSRKYGGACFTVELPYMERG
ncbi:MAG: HAMP domain-containing histidine kinase, partial [Desulfobacterales bacterium]|nr:HAMP domain-containing histidine kinase [Desulfobacterales bacterium]